MITYRVAFKKTFETGNLAGLSVDGSFDCELWADAAMHVRNMERNPRHADLQGSVCVWSNVRIESVWPDGTIRQEMA